LKGLAVKTASDKNRSAESDYVVLYGVPWKTYEGILDALGEYHLRHTYDEGTLEMRRVLYGVTWQDYLKLLDATADLYLRHTYDEGTLEMMGPRKDHDWVAGMIARMIEAYVLAVDFPVQSVGSMTLRASKGGRGIQPDRAYYLANEPKVRCKDTYDPEHDPPPDLVIEVDVTSTSVPRMPVLAEVGVPEVWRNERGRARFYRLKSKAKYELVEHSLAFPFLKPADLMRFVRRRAEIGENAVVREFVEWAKKATTNN
jgi:Uma2 family endonuclease